MSFSSWVCVQEWSKINILGRVLGYWQHQWRRYSIYQNYLTGLLTPCLCWRSEKARFGKRDENFQTVPEWARGLASNGWDLSRMAFWFYHSWFLWPCELTEATDINTDPSCCWTKTQDMALKQQLGPVIHPGSVWKHWSLKSESIWWQHGPKQHQVSSLESAWSSVPTRTMNINTDPVCNMAMNTDMTPISLLSYTTQNLLSGLTPCAVA